MASEFKSCSVSDCNGNAHHSKRGVRGLCNVHYGRLLRHGDPLAGRTRNGEPMRFLRELVASYNSDECLPWPYAKDGDGYGKICVDGKMELVSRYICSLVHGDAPTPEHQAAHSCGNGHLACASPMHVRWATRKENETDKILHGTGEASFSAKITFKVASDIKNATGSHRYIAKQWGLSHSTVGKIKRGERWQLA